MTGATFTPVKLPYRFEFRPDQIDAMLKCNNEHGFAIVKDVLSDTYVDELKGAVKRESEARGPLEAGGTRTIHAFVEFAPEMLKLFENEKWMRIQRALLGTDELTVHRSAAIFKEVGAPPIAWHTDYGGFHTGPWRNSGDVLNVGEHPNGKWFYLNGTHPNRAGLCIIADSHRPDYELPAGFAFHGADRKTFYRTNDPEKQVCRDMDIEGCVALLTDPGDMIVFAARTYHFATGHGGTEPRLSAALGFRGGRHAWPVPWELPESAKKLKASLPARLRPYFEAYPSIDVAWRAADPGMGAGDAMSAPKPMM